MDWVEWLTALMAAGLVPVVFGFFMGNCPCCGDQCIYFEDGFATDNLATDYDDRSGSWAVSLGLLTTSSANALIVANETIPTGISDIFAEVQMSFVGTLDTGRLVINYDDDDNYWFAEVQAGATDGTLKLFERSGGTNTQRGSTTTIPGLQVNETVTVQLCYSDGVVRASGDRAFIDYTATLTVAETKCGLGTGSGTGARSFNNFVFGPHYTEDSECRRCGAGCGCVGTVCECNVAPIEATVTFSGFSNAGGACTQCASWNATFIITGEWTDGGFPGGICQCPFFQITPCTTLLEVRKTTVTTLNVRIGGGGGVWENTSVDADCTDFVDVVCPQTSYSLATCNHDGSDVLVTLT